MSPSPADVIDIQEQKVENLVGDFLSGKFPKEMQDERYEDLKSEYNLAEYNVEELTKIFYRRFGNNEAPGDLLIYLKNRLEREDQNNALKKANKKLAESITKRNNLLEEIKDHCRSKLLSES